MDERILRSIGVLANGLKVLSSLLYCINSRRARLVKSSKFFQNTFIVEYGSPTFQDQKPYRVLYVTKLVGTLAKSVYERLKRALHLAMALLRYSLTKPEYILDIVICLFWLQ